MRHAERRERPAKSWPWRTGAIAADLDGFAVMDVLQWILAGIAAVGVALIVFAVRQSRRALSPEP
jgi:hypothetical protein